jgi:caffeoyl-CoA O-methyltransferase
MKDRVGAILREGQERYLERLLPPRDALLQEMERVSVEEDIPSSDPEVGRLLQILAAGVKARRVLEVGTAIGYGTLCLARGAPEARVVTIDADPERLARAREFLTRGEVADRVELVEGEALKVLPGLEGPFDLVYLDAVKREYKHYLDLVLPLLSIGGMVVIDNLLWKGRVAELPEDEEEDDTTRAVRAFNPYFCIHPQLKAMVLPLGDGLGVGTKIQPTVREMGGPF